MKVMLIAPPKKGLAGSEKAPPIGLGYLATALRGLGHEPEIIDCVVRGWDIDNLIEYVRSSDIDIAGINTWSLSLRNVKEILERTKFLNPDIVTVIGGPHPSAVPESALKYLPEADYGVVGEGEIPLKGLLRFIETGKGHLKKIPGLIWREGDAIRWNPRIEHDNLDSLGFPAWDLIDMPRYFSSLNFRPGECVIHATRGCPFGCEFCVKLGRKLRFRSLDHIYEEISFLHENYGITTFQFGDEGFSINIKFVKSFCRYVIEKGDNFRYFSGPGLRLNCLDDEMLELMKKANFIRRVSVGIESGVPRVRKLMNKRLSQKDIYRGLELLNKHGFHTSGNFILGFPGETKEEMEQTIRLALKLKLWGAAFTPFIPLPGSVATNKLIAQGKIPQDFDFSEIDLDVVLYAPDGMTLEELDKMRRKAAFKFNIRPRMIRYHMSGGRLYWSIVKFFRIFSPSWLTPEAWRR